MGRKLKKKMKMKPRGISHPLLMFLTLCCGVLTAYAAYADQSLGTTHLISCRQFRNFFIGMRLRGGRKGVSAKHTTTEIARKTVRENERSDEAQT